MAEISFDDLFNAIISRESGGDPNARSPQGASGSAQIMPGTFKDFAKPGERFDRDADRVKAARRYLTYLGEHTNWDAHKMAQGYISGTGGIGKNRADGLGTKTQDYANQVLARVKSNQKEPVMQDANLSFDDLIPNKTTSNEDLSFDDLVPQKSTAPSPSIMQQIYANSEPTAGVIGGLGGGLLGAAAGPVGAVAGGALGTAGALGARRAIGSLLGYEQPLDAGGLAVETGKNLVQGAAAEGGGQIIARAISPVISTIAKPGDAVRSLLGGNQTSIAAQAAARDTLATGIPLSAAQRSGSDFAIGAERTLEAVPGGKGVYVPFKEAQITSATNALDNAITDLGTANANPGWVGIRVLHSFNRLTRESMQARSAQGAADFAFLDTSLGNTRYLPVTRFTEVVQREVDNLATVGASPANRTKAIQLQRTLNDLAEAGGRVTGKDMNNLLSQYSGAMHGGDSIFEGLAANSADRALAARLYNALDSDLGNAAINPGMQQSISEGIAQARLNWRMHSDALTQTKNSAIGKILGGDVPPSGEAIYSKVVNMAPSDIRQTTRLLDGIDPSVMRDVRARYLEDLVDKASKVTTHPGESAVVEKVLNPGEFTKLSVKNRTKLNALIDNPVQQAQIEAITNQLARISSTSKPNSFIGRASNFAGAGGAGLVLTQSIYGNPVTAVAAGGAMATAYLSNRSIARALTNQEGINAMRTLMSPNVTRQGAISAWNTLINYGASVNSE